MEPLAEQIGYTLPLGIAVFVGSYIGIFKKSKLKLPGDELAVLFLFLWLLSAALLMIFRGLLSNLGQDAMPEGLDLAGPLVVGIFIGRKLVSWRRQIHEGKADTVPGQDAPPS